MPWLPLMHLSGSHCSALCQFRSSAVGHRAPMASGVACQIPRKLSSSHPERGCWRQTSKSPRTGSFRQAVGCTRAVCKDNSLLSGTVCSALVPLFLANAHLFLPEFGARPQIPPALSFNPTGEAAAIYSGKDLMNCLFNEMRICIPAATAFFPVSVHTQAEEVPGWTENAHLRGKVSTIQTCCQ